MRTLSLFLALILSYSTTAQIPFETVPSYESTAMGHYATGLGLADINGDGWKDIITANGNDILRQRLCVYYNNGDGTFPLSPDWQSNDIDYHGHLSAGDVDLDGDVDIAVSVYLGPMGFGYPGKVKVYYNSGYELEGTPSFQSQYMYTFSCALGDADGDGDLDIAVACGEPFGSDFDHGRIFFNENGSFDPVAGWESDVEMGALDVEFGDVDRNGFLDLIFVCQYTDNYIFLADNQGYIDPVHDWFSDLPQNFMNSVEFGLPCATASPCFVSTGNDQLGGDGKIKQFVFSNPIPAISPPGWESGYVGNGSGILMAEVNSDENLDLLYGSWWGPLEILEGNCGSWDPLPVYTSLETSVVEAILVSDLGKFNYQAESITIKPLAEKGVLTLPHHLLERISAVVVNSQELDRNEYAYTELDNWISFKNNIMPGDVVTIDYDYSAHGDIVITNWDPDVGNFIYYNMNNPVGREEGGTLPVFGITGIHPQPANDQVFVHYQGFDTAGASLFIYDPAGRMAMRKKIDASGKFSIHTGDLMPGLYILQMSDGGNSSTQKLLISR